MGRLAKRLFDLTLVAILILSVAALFLTHEEPFARNAWCSLTGFCPVVANVKALNKILYDLAVGALVSLIFYALIVRLPDHQKRRRLKKNLAAQYKQFREDCIALMLGVADGAYDWDLSKKLTDQDKFRAYFSEWISRDQDRWHVFQNKLDEYHLKELKKRMEIFRDQIAFVLNNVDIPGDEPLQFMNRLSIAIYSLQDTTLGYDDTKSFANFLWTIFAGFDFITGYREEDVVKKMIDTL